MGSAVAVLAAGVAGGLGAVHALPALLARARPIILAGAVEEAVDATPCAPPASPKI
jgi:hypothetical protein